MIPNPQTTTVQRDSVQGRADATQNFGMGDVAPAAGLFWLSLAHYNDIAPPLDFIYLNARDRWNKDLARQESMMSAAIYAMKTRAQTLAYQVNGDEAPKKRAEELLLSPGLGDSYESLVGKIVDDLYTTNNGVFVERIAGGDPRTPIGDREILGFAHIDSLQCWRTFDPTFPVIYTNPQTGVRHALHRDRVIMAADNVQSNELARGAGFCAVDRTLQWVRIIRDSVIYREEKVSGRFTRAIGWAEGLTKEQLRKALNQVDVDDEASDLVVYKKIPFITAMTNPTGAASNVKLNLLDLASIPDGFVFKDDVTLYAYILSFCFGVDAREFWPMTSSGATRGDATVQHIKSQGKGIGFLIRQLEWIFRQCLPRAVTFEYDYTDDEQDKLVAELRETKTRTYDIAVKAKALSPKQMYDMMIADGTLDEQVVGQFEIPTNEMALGADDEANGDALNPPADAGEEDDFPGRAQDSKKKRARSPSKPAAQTIIAAP